jgi:hypothetical protein
MPWWQISSAREHTYQFGFFHRRKKRKRKKKKEEENLRRHQY